MASIKDFLEFVLEQLRELDNISYRYMMGEYILYYNGVIFGGIYDNRLLLKKTKSNEKYNLPVAIPYPKGKPMYLITDIDDTNFLNEIINVTYEDLK